MLKTVVMISYALRSVTAICSGIAVTLKALLERDMEGAFIV